MYYYLNLHPQGKRVGDCVKRAIAGATGKDYMEVQRELNRTKKLTNTTRYSENDNWKYYVVEVLKAPKMSFPAQRGVKRMNGESFCKAFPKGKYILRMAKHLTCCVDGIIYDTWDCSDKCVYEAYKVM